MEVVLPYLNIVPDEEVSAPREFEAEVFIFTVETPPAKLFQVR